MRLPLLAAAAALLVPAAASAAETVTYAYDAKGRLVSVGRTGSGGGPVVTTYAFDAADNRTQVTTTGAWLADGARPVVVTPLAAGAVIPLPER